MSIESRKTARLDHAQNAALADAQSGAVSRRDMLWQLGGGLGGVALASLLARDGRLLAAEPNASGSAAKRHDAQPGSPLAVRQPHFAASSKRVIVLFCAGAVSQVDSVLPADGRRPARR